MTCFVSSATENPNSVNRSISLTKRVCVGILWQSRPDSTKKGICRNFIKGLDIQILYANVGELRNPQARIVGAKYNFVYADHITFQVRYGVDGRECFSV